MHSHSLHCSAPRILVNKNEPHVRFACNKSLPAKAICFNYQRLEKKKKFRVIIYSLALGGSGSQAFNLYSNPSSLCIIQWNSREGKFIDGDKSQPRRVVHLWMFLFFCSPLLLGPRRDEMTTHNRFMLMRANGSWVRRYERSGGAHGEAQTSVFFFTFSLSLVPLPPLSRPLSRCLFIFASTARREDRRVREHQLPCAMHSCPQQAITHHGWYVHKKRVGQRDGCGRPGQPTT